MAKISLYGLEWPDTTLPISREMHMIRRGGQWEKKNGSGLAGKGLFFHMKRFEELLWPEKVWHAWNIDMLDCFCKYRYIGVMGCAAAGKSDSSGSDHLAYWYCVPELTTVLVSSTDFEALERRVWGMIKKYHRLAKQKYSFIPGHLIESRRMIVLNSKTEASEGRDFRNGLLAVPTKKGGSYVGLGSLVGIHNHNVFLLGDEFNLMPRAFMDATSNLSKCPNFKLTGLGNPNETTNAHGMLCEPAQELGGWESGIDQQPKTKRWKTNFPDGICLQLPGSDSPNMKAGPNDPPPFPFLMTRQQMEDDAKIWGKEDWHYTMMNDARMPRGQGTRRIITRQMCEKFGATLEPFWRDSNRTRVAFLDAAYRGVGGDRCVFGELQFGLESEPPDPAQVLTNLMARDNSPKGRQIISLIDLVTIPISMEKGSESPEDQIVSFVQSQCGNRGIPEANFYYDAGMRTSLVSAFSRLGWAMANPVDCGGKPSAEEVSEDIKLACHEYYQKFITELWYSVRLVIEARQFRGLTKDAMWEFCSREWKHTSNNKIEAETKEEMKVKTGRSPDLADAIAVGVYGARKLGFKIARLTDSRQHRRSSGWKNQVQKQAEEKWNEGRLNHAA